MKAGSPARQQVAGWRPDATHVTLAARGKSVSQPVEVTGDTRLDIAAGALEARQELLSQQLAALQRIVQRRRRAGTDGMWAAEYARIDTPWWQRTLLGATRLRHSCGRSRRASTRLVFGSARGSAALSSPTSICDGIWDASVIDQADGRAAAHH